METNLSLRKRSGNKAAMGQFETKVSEKYEGQVASLKTQKIVESIPEG